MGVIGVLLSRWVLSFVGIVLLALLVWVFGPLLDMLESWLPRLVLVLLLLLGWAGANLLLDRRRRGRERALEEGVTGPTPARGETGAAEEAAALAGRMSEALALLKRARGTSGYLYEQPGTSSSDRPGPARPRR